MRILISIGLIFHSLFIQAVYSQSFYFGADLSYVNEMEDCGAMYTVENAPSDPYSIFKANHTNLIRLRLWHTPSWYDNLNEGNRYSDLADVRASIARAKELAMDVLLDFHLSDNWADPAHQVAPAAWTAVLDDLPVLQDSLYNYIHSTLLQLAAEDLLPDMVQIGNETNKGILQSQAQNDAGWWLDWDRNSALFNTAIDAVRDVETATGDSIKIAIHIADPADVGWFFEQFHNYGVTDFDILGISYYASYHQLTIPAVGAIIVSLREEYPGKEVMILETAYPWTTAGNDAANNVLSGVAGYTPTIDNQKRWLVDLTQTVINAGGSGVVYWEPAWVSTSCYTQWAQGSHWENAAFFGFDNDLHENGAALWSTYPYDFPTAVDDVEPGYSPFSMFASDGKIFIKQVGAMQQFEALLLNVIGADGKLVHSEKFDAPGLGNQTVINEAFSMGVYTIQILQRNAVVALEQIVVIK